MDFVIEKSTSRGGKSLGHVIDAMRIAGSQIAIGFIDKIVNVKAGIELFDVS